VNPGKSSWHPSETLERKQTERMDHEAESLRASGNLIAGVKDTDVHGAEMYPFRAGGQKPFETGVIDICLRNGYATAVTKDGLVKWRVNSGEKAGEREESFSEKSEIVSTEYGEVVVDPGEDRLIALDDEGRFRNMERGEGFGFEPRTACVDEKGRLCYVHKDSYELLALDLSDIFQGLSLELVSLGNLDVSADGLAVSMASVNGSFYVTSSVKEDSSFAKLEDSDGSLEIRDFRNLMGEQVVGRPVTNDEFTVLNLGEKVAVLDTEDGIRSLREVEVNGEVSNVEMLGSGASAKVIVYASQGVYEIDAETGDKKILEDTKYVDPFRTVRSKNGGVVVEYGLPGFEANVDRADGTVTVENGEHESRYMLRMTDKSDNEVVYQEEITRRLEPGETYRKPISEIFEGGTKE